MKKHLDWGLSRKGSIDRMDICTLGRQRSRKDQQMQRQREGIGALEASAENKVSTPEVTAR